ncbi:MAG TPA: hypothetical protein VKA19_08970 [Alphaproteobacteria bacterium]|nr:hypothetical protein [Alphaproteobacteria bacterium]
MSRNRKEKLSRKPDLIAYHVPEREKAPWSRIGAAWDHKDGDGLTLELDLVPVATGRIVLRAPKAEEEEER